MKNTVLIIFILCLIFLGCIVFLKTNPPLTSPGASFYEDDETKRVVEIVNTGFTHIKINNVLVNGKEASKAEIGTSRTNHLVVGGGLEDDPYITFHSIEDLVVEPKLAMEKYIELNKKGDKETIKHYGLRVFGNEVPETITIKYSYLGIPYSLDINVKK